MNKKNIKNIILFVFMIFFLIACDESEKLIKDARKSMAEKDYRTAIEFLKSATSINRSNPDIYYEYGNIYFEKEDYNKAISNYNKAIRLKTDDAAIIFYKMGLSCEKKHDRRRSIINYLKAVKIDNSILEAHVALAKYYITRRLYNKVADECDAILKIDPSSSDAYYLMGLAYEKRREGKNALLCYNRAANQKNEDAINRIQEIIDLQKLAVSGDRGAKRQLIRSGLNWME